MGLGRRGFLKCLGGAAASIILNPGSAVSIDNEFYINRKLGVAFYAPVGWHFSDVRQMGEVLEGQISATESERAKELLANEPLPILTVSRDVLGSKNQFTPGITIYLDHFLQPASEIDMRTEVKYDLMQSRRLFEKFEVLTEFNVRVLSACPAIENTARFLYQHEHLEPTMVRMRTIAVNQYPAYYTIRMFDSPYISDGSVHCYDEFLENFKLV